MANTLSKSGISTTQTIEAWHVTQSVDAFTGTKLYNISISGSLNMTGSINTPPGTINNATASYSITASHALNAADSLFTATGISGSLGSNASLIRSLTSTGISGSWQAQTSSMTVATASYANQLYGSPSIVVNHITASGNISSSGAYYGDGSNLTGITSINTGSLGNTVITGSLTVSGSNTFKNIGPAEFIGDTTITGSLIVSGSFNAFRVLTSDVIIGENAGFSQTVNANSNVFIGVNSAYTNTTGDHNVVLGNSAGYNMSTNASNENVIIGKEAGYGTTTGGHVGSVLLGRRAGYSIKSGDYNIGIGYSSLYDNQTGNRNIVIGYKAGQDILKDDNIVIGYEAGQLLVSGSNIFMGSGSLGGPGIENHLRIGHADLITISASLATGDIIFPSSASFTGLPTSEPEITGSIWMSGSSAAHPKSQYLMIFNP